MNMKLYSLKDTKAGNFDRVWPAPNHVVALRTVTPEVNRKDPANMINSNPEDFELYCVGTFDSDTGSVDPELTLIAALITLVKD